MSNSKKWMSFSALIVAWNAYCLGAGIGSSTFAVVIITINVMLFLFWSAVP